MPAYVPDVRESVPVNSGASPGTRRFGDARVSAVMRKGACHRPKTIIKYAVEFPPRRIGWR